VLLLACTPASRCAGTQPAGRDTSLTIFACPKPLQLPYTADDPQIRALRTWLALKSKPQVVLLGNDASLHAVAADHERVSVEPQVDTNFVGTPLFNSIVQRTLYADTAFAAFVNSDIMLFDDLVAAALKLQGRFADFVATAARWDLPSWPFTFSPTNGFTDGAGTPRTTSQVIEFMKSNGTLHAYGGTDVWVWNTNATSGSGGARASLPLHKGTMPPFTYGRGKYDNWLNHEIESTGLRALVDVTTVVTSVHVAHTYAHVDLGTGTAPPHRQLLNFWSQHKRTSWEQFANIVHAQTHGTYVNQLGTLFHASWKLTQCLEPAADSVCLAKRARPAKCGCEYASDVLRSDKDPVLKGTSWTCGSVSVDSLDKFQVTGRPANNDSYPGLPHTLEQLLPQVADASGTVILTGLMGNYGAFLMNFVCQARKLNVSNVLVAAFDEEAYRFAFLQGLPVFFFDNAALLNSTNCHYGTPCFRSVTKSKSRAVLKVLELGYNVLFSDVDIVWFENPLPELQALGAAGDLLVQSNEPNYTYPANGYRRINSGFYYASANEASTAFRLITEHTASTMLSEQPSFYEVLCGGGNFTVGDDACQLPGGVKTIFLNRDVYPNGAYKGLWEAPDVRLAARGVGAKILHNNWAVGAATKKRRQMHHWHYDENLFMCTYDWAKGDAA
jgi:hypothetical protein